MFQLPYEFLIRRFFLVYFLSVLTCIALVPSSAINLGSPPCSSRVCYVDKEKDHVKHEVHTADSNYLQDLKGNKKLFKKVSDGTVWGFYLNCYLNIKEAFSET